MRTQGCGHGECTTADTPCRYESGSRVVGTAQTDATAGGRVEVRLDAPRLPERRRMSDQAYHGQWSWRDLDRCEHGRHSIDHCFDCGPGVTPSNGFLLGSVGWRSRTRYVDGRLEVRIGTMVRGEPIWVVVRDRPREKEAEMSEQEADGKLPCGECGHRVRPGRHTVAECTRFQIEDAEKPGDGTSVFEQMGGTIINPKEQNDGE